MWSTMSTAQSWLTLNGISRRDRLS